MISSNAVPPHGATPEDVPGSHLLELIAVVDTLRRSCPWDREQTHASLLRYLLEEAYEAAETIEDDDMPALREEIGDVLFQVLFHARIASERTAAEGGFTIDDVADTLAAKLIRRHPHVFGSVSASSAAEVNAKTNKMPALTLPTDQSVPSRLAENGMIAKAPIAHTSEMNGAKR